MTFNSIQNLILYSYNRGKYEKNLKVFCFCVCRLWVHFCAVYIVTVFVCYLLYYVSQFSEVLSGWLYKSSNLIWNNTCLTDASRALCLYMRLEL